MQDPVESRVTLNRLNMQRMDDQPVFDVRDRRSYVLVGAQKYGDKIQEDGWSTGQDRGWRSSVEAVWSWDIALNSGAVVFRKDRQYKLS
jgi:hypothetical protein